ncbi:hatching enzyme 1.2-like isoform X2 [Paramormyrops kingsleyae]|nr:high choriolytic enzyme 1-like [Paramormyrops kingsleyae]
MDHKFAFTILALLLSLSKAYPVTEDGGEEGTHLEDHLDLSRRILEANNGSSQMLVEGDLLITNTKNAMICYMNICLWPKSANGLVEVPYVISSGFSTSDIQVIQSAINAFSSKTCIRFTPWTSQSDYLSIENLYGCYSSIGKIGGKQVVSLMESTCLIGGIVQHELNHALGFYHEHVRSDRDRYVRINWKYVDPNETFNFDKQNTTNEITAYDYGSVMHYGRTAFTIKPGMDTITPIPDETAQIGQRNGLSQSDILRINKLYGC